MVNIPKIFFLAGLALLAVGCSNDGLDSENKSNQLTPVNVRVEGFSIEQASLTRVTRATESLANYNDVNAVTLAFYKGDGTEVVKTTQLKADASTFTTFGEFACSLPMGSYTMVVLAYLTNENSVLTLTSPTEASYSLRARETFAYTQAVNITNNNAVDISATLSRIVSRLTVNSTDGKTADVSNVRVTFAAGSKDFNPSTGFALTNTGFANTVGNGASVGSTSSSSTYLFLSDVTQNINVTIETLDALGNTLFSETVNDVPFKRNRVTKLTGAMYTNSGIGGTFNIETAWLDDENINF